MARIPFEQRTVTYGSVGGTQAPDLLQYPPRGYRPLETRGRVGHGEARWNQAVEQLLTGGVYRGAGMAARVVPASGGQDAAHYLPVSYDEHGRPVEAAALEVPDDEFSAEGQRYLRPGDTIVIGPALRGHLLFPLPGRVVLREQSENRVLYATGTLPGHPFSGEESFILDRMPDGAVWLTVRSFAKPANVGWVFASPALLLVRRAIAKRFLRALSAPIEGSAPLPSQRSALEFEAPSVTEEPRPTTSGIGRVLVAVYAVLALASTGRSGYQIVTRFAEAPVAYSLSAVAAVVYVVATVALVARGRTAFRVAAVAIGVELIGVLVVGALSAVDPALFPRDTVWSHFGQGYLFIPLVLPVLGLLWLRRVRRMHRELEAIA